LVKMRKNLRDPAVNYKAYKGRHFSARLYEVRNITEPTKAGQPALYYVNKKWRDRDEIMLVTGVDAETDRIVAERVE